MPRPGSGPAMWSSFSVSRNSGKLSNSGMPSELIDRVYRALFVYSVGFYELVKKCLGCTGKRYSIITNLWKVFAILLEYCSKSDYRLLISEISRQHKE